MKVVLQRVKNAYVEVDGDKISEIDHGLLLLWGVEEEDSDADSEVLIN
jgi:D-tyrosyl-tRNA(Tyr) deacylase